MELQVDLTLPERGFFISTPVAEEEMVSFDTTLGKQRIIRQRKTGERQLDREPDSTWVTVVSVDGELVEFREEEWWDEEDFDVVNGEVWRITAEKPLSGQKARDLAEFFQKVYDSREDGEKLEEALGELDDYLETWLGGKLEEVV